MPAPVVNTASFVTVSVSAGATASPSFTVSGNANRKIFIFNGSKDNSTTSDAPTSSITFDSSGVNLSIGAGITRVGTAQLAQEGQYSSAGDLFEIKDSDMGAARTVTIDIANLGLCQRQLWVIFEVYDANQAALDATAEHIDTVDVSGNTQHSDSITSTVDNCLLIGFWGLSLTGSSTGTWTTTLTALWDTSINNQSGSNGDMAVVYTTKVTAGAQALDFTHTTAISRHAGKLVSIAPAGGTPVSQAFNGELENLAVASANVVTPTESLAAVAQNVSGRLETLTPVIGNVVPLFEDLQGIQQSAVAEYECQGNVAVSKESVFYIDSLGQVSQAMIGQLENLRSESQGYQALHEQLAPVAQPLTLQVESIGYVTDNVDGNIEVLATLSTNTVSQYENLVGIAGQVQADVEVLKSISTATGIPYEALQGANINTVVNLVQRTAYFRITLARDASFRQMLKRDATFNQVVRKDAEI